MFNFEDIDLALNTYRTGNKDPEKMKHAIKTIESIYDNLPKQSKNSMVKNDLEFYQKAIRELKSKYKKLDNTL